MAGLTLDAGALIALERNDRRVSVLLGQAREDAWAIAIPAGVIGQVWRDGKRQVRLARFLRTPEIEIVPLDDERARAAGQLCGMRGTADVIDASVVLCARARGHDIITTDPDDLARLDPRVKLVTL